MGVKGLWKIISKYGEQTSTTDLTLAVDTSIWIHQYKGLSEHDAVYLVSKKIIKLLYHNISPVFVFDGPANPLKRRVIEDRKKINTKEIIKDIINNAKCKKCKISIRICPHNSILKDEFDEKELIGYKEWGTYQDYVDEDNNDSNTKSDYTFVDNLQLDKNNVQSFLDSKTISNHKKLRLLVKLREQRKNSLSYNKNSLMSFSKSQLKNVKNRNLVSHYIKKLEAEKSIPLGSDCTKEYLFTKSTTNKVKKDIKIEDSSSTELNDFLEVESDNKFSGINLQHERKDKTWKCESRDKNLQQGSTTINNKSTNADTEKVVVFQTNSEHHGDGFFGKKTDIEIKEDLEYQKIEYDFALTKPIEYAKISTQSNETVDFLSIQTIIKDILDAFCLPYIDSPSEADAQCAFLCKNKTVEGVITEDNDILLHGGIVYKNFFRKNKSILRFDPKKILEELKISELDFINLGYILGSDYTTGVKGVGIKKALEYVKSLEFKNTDTGNYTSVYTNSPINEDCTPKFQTIRLEKVSKFWTKKKLTKDRIDELKFYLKSKYTNNLDTIQHHNYIEMED